MKKKFMRVLSFILACILTTSMVYTPVFAFEGDDGVVTYETEEVEELTDEQEDSSETDVFEDASEELTTKEDSDVPEEEQTLEENEDDSSQEDAFELEEYDEPALDREKYTKQLDIYGNTESFDYMEEYGIAWDSKTKVLTMDNAYVESTICLGTADATVKLIGNNTINVTDHYALYVRAYCSVLIMGSGCLDIKTAAENKKETVKVYGTLIIDDNATVSIEGSNNYYLVQGGNLVLKGTLNLVDYQEPIRLINIDPDGSFEMGDNGKLFVEYRGSQIIVNVFEGGKIDISKGIIKAKLDNPLESDVAVINVFDSEALSEKDLERPFDNLKLDKGLWHSAFMATAGVTEWSYGTYLPGIKFKNQQTSVAAKNGNFATLKVDAEAVGGTTYSAITYKWYKGDGTLVPGAETSELTTDALNDTEQTYYCVATGTVDGKTVSAQSETITVHFNNTGHIRRNGRLDLNEMESTSNEQEGWDWNSETHTLTLSDFDMKGNRDDTLDNGYYAIVLPEFSTIICNGKNLIDCVDGECHPIQGLGQLTIVVNGSLDIKSSENTMVNSGGYIKLIGTINNSAQNEGSQISGTQVTSYYEAKIVANDKPYLYFKDEPGQNLYTTTLGKSVPTLSRSAELVGGEGDIRYYWVSSSEYIEFSNGNPEAADICKEGAFVTPDCSKRGTTYYTCFAETTIDGVTYRESSRPVCVVVGAKGVNPVINQIEITQSTGDESGSGWKWDSKSATLTLSNFEGCFPFSSNNSIFIAGGFEEVKVILASGSINNVANGIYSYDNLNITGNGRLNARVLILSRIKCLQIGSGVKVQCEEVHTPETIAMFGSSLTSGIVTCSELIMKNGSQLNVTGGSSSVGLTADNINIDKGCKVVVDGKYSTSLSTSYLTVAGELILNYPQSKAWLTIYKETDSLDKQFTLKGTKLVEEQSCNMIEGDNHWSYTAPSLTIVPNNFSFKAMPKVTIAEKDGIMQSTLGNSSATVRYCWQYADYKTAGADKWKDINSSDVSSFCVPSKYEGKYIRLKITGYGEYKGTAYSNVYGPVKAGGPYLLDVELNGISLNKDRGFLPDDETFYCTVYDSKVRISAITAEEDASVKIEDVNNPDTVIEGKEGTFSLVEGNNQIMITVASSDGETKEYTFNIEPFVSKSKMLLRSCDYDAGVRLSAAIALEDGSIDNHNVSDDSETVLELPIDTQVKVEAKVDKTGWYVSNFTDPNLLSKGILEDNVWEYSFMTSSQYERYEVIPTEYRMSAPNMTAHWERETDWYGSHGDFYLQVEGDMTPREALLEYDTSDYKLVAELVDEDGYRVGLHPCTTGYFIDVDSANNVAYIDGCNEGTLISLDPYKNYTLRLWYNSGGVDDWLNTECSDVQEINIPALSDELILEEEYMVLERPSGTENVVGEVGIKVPGNGVARTYVYGDSEHIIAYQDGDKLKVTVSQGAACQTSYILVEDASKKVLRVDVVESASVAEGYLTVKTGNIDLYKNVETVIPINIVGDISLIDRAEFMNPEVASKYELKVSGTRELTVSPKVIEDGNFDWAAKIKMLTGKYNSDIKVTLKSGKTFTLSGYAFTVKASTPSVSVDKITFNSFFDNDNKDLNIKSKGNIITKIAVDTGKAGLKTPAIPEWVSLSEDGMSLNFDKAVLNGTKANATVYLKVWFEGIEYPVQTKVAVSVSETKPSFKLSQTTLTLADDFRTTAYVNIVPGKGVTLPDLDITDVRVAKVADMMKLSDKDRAAYEASRYYDIIEYDNEKGLIRIYSPHNTVIPGKMLLIFTIGGNDNQTVSLPVAIKTVDHSKITLKPDKASVTFNKVWGNSGEFEQYNVTIIPSASGVCDTDRTGITVKDAKGNDYTAAFRINHNSNYVDDLTYVVYMNSDIPVGTYTATFNYENVVKSPTVKINVVNKKPTLKLSKTSVSFDIYKWNHGNNLGTEDVRIRISSPDVDKLRNWRIDKYSCTVKDKSGEIKDRVFLDQFEQCEDGNVDLNLILAEGATAGAYTVTISLELPDGQVVTSNIKVNITAKAPQIKVKKTQATLNKDLLNNGYDYAKFVLTRPDGYDYDTAKILSVKNSKGVAVENVIAYYLESAIESDMENTLLLYATADAEYGQTYTVTVTESVYYAGIDKKKDISYSVKVKIAPQSKGRTVITQTTKVGKAMDLSLSECGTKVVNTYQGWNGDVLNINNIFTSNLPQTSWYVTAKNGNKLYTDSTITDGVVAKGDNSYNYYNGWFETSLCKCGADRYTGEFTIEPNYAVTGDPGVLNPNLKYTLTVTTVFPGYNSDGTDLVLTKSVPLTIKIGTVKVKTSCSELDLCSFDKYDSEIVKIDIDNQDVKVIENVKIKGNSQYDCTLIGRNSNSAFVAIGWNGDVVPAKPKAETVTLELYFKENKTEFGKPNATTKIKVTPK